MPWRRRERERDKAYPNLSETRTYFHPRKPHNVWGANRPGGLTRPLCPGEEEEKTKQRPRAEQTLRKQKGSRSYSRFYFKHHTWRGCNARVHASPQTGRGEFLCWAAQVALHWSLTQFTPASMDVQPQNTIERSGLRFPLKKRSGKSRLLQAGKVLHSGCFAISVVIFALVGFSYVVGDISSCLMQRGPQVGATDRFLNEVYCTAAPSQTDSSCPSVM